MDSREYQQYLADLENQGNLRRIADSVGGGGGGGDDRAALLRLLAIGGAVFLCWFFWAQVGPVLGAAWDLLAWGLGVLWDLLGAIWHTIVDARNAIQ
jgi:hypothetical protein